MIHNRVRVRRKTRHRELRREVVELRRRGIRVLLAGMLAAPNWGPDYGGAFNRIYPELARRHGAELYPFFLAGVTGERAHQLDDQLHPNFIGIKRIVSGILPIVMKTIGR